MNRYRVIFITHVNSETLNDFYSILLIANRYRVISTTYVNSETLNDFYNILLIAKQRFIL